MIDTQTVALSHGPAEWRKTAFAMAMFVIAAGMLAITLDLLDRPTQAVVWAGLALASYAMGLLALIAIRETTGFGLAQWRFGPWIMLWYCVAFGLATTAWNQPQTGIPAQIAISSVLRALGFVVAGMTLWALGYFIGPGRLVRKAAISRLGWLSRHYAPEVRSRSVPWILFGIGTIASLGSAVTTGRFGYVGNVAPLVTTASGYDHILGLLALCSPLAVAASALQVFRERVPGSRITLICLVAAELPVGLASGVKETTITTVLAVVIPFSAARRRLPKAALTASLLGFLIIVIPFTLVYRDAARNGATTITTRQAIDMVPSVLGQTVSQHQISAALPASAGYLLGRMREIDATAIILQRTPSQIGFLSPLHLVIDPLSAIVPRAIWPGKPILSTGYQISQEYYGLPSTNYTSTAISQKADLYRYGGWIPMLAGMFVLGLGVRLIDEVFDIRANPQAIFMTLLLLPTLMKNEVGWVPILASLPSVAVIWLLGVAITFRRRRPA